MTLCLCELGRRDTFTIELAKAFLETAELAALDLDPTILDEVLGKPDYVYADWSWLKKICEP